MLPNTIYTKRNQHDQWLVWALILWSICLLVVSIRLMVVEPGRRSLYPIYDWAGKTWRAGNDLYPSEKKGFGFPLYRYSPGVAALMAPLSYLPYRPADLLWHFINWAALLGSLVWWARAALALTDRGTIGKLLMLVLPLAIGNLNNGQSNSVVLAATIAGLAAVASERWNLAAVLITLACLFKVYPIAIGLLLVALYPRRFLLPLAGALALGLALPFVLQEPAYVLRQYKLWLDYMGIEDRTTWPIFYNNLDFQLLCRVWLAPISPRTYQIIQLVSAGIIGMVCLSARLAGETTSRLLTLVLGLGSVWMTVFGPATESPTYMLLAPTAAWAVLSAWRDGGSRLLQGLLLAAYGLLISAQMVAWFAGMYLPYRALGPQPLAGLLLALGLAMLFRGVANQGVFSCARSGSPSPS